MKKSNQFSPEVRERAVRMVREHRSEFPRADIRGHLRDGRGLRLDR